MIVHWKSSNERLKTFDTLELAHIGSSGSYRCRRYHKCMFMKDSQNDPEVEEIAGKVTVRDRGCVDGRHTWNVGKAHLRTGIIKAHVCRPTAAPSTSHRDLSCSYSSTAPTSTRRTVYVTSVGLIVDSSPIAGLPRRDVQDIASHSSRRESRTISRMECTIVTDGVSESISCTEFTNIPTFVRK